MITPRLARRFARMLFVAALAFSLYEAFVPASKAVQILPWDKAEHFVAFYVLALLAAAAAPNVGLVWIGLALSAVGAGIEVVQGLPFVHRDADVRDWAADTIAILSAYVPLMLPAWRRFVGQADAGARRRGGL